MTRRLFITVMVVTLFFSVPALAGGSHYSLVIDTSSDLSGESAVTADLQIVDSEAVMSTSLLNQFYFQFSSSFLPVLEDVFRLSYCFLDQKFCSVFLTVGNEWLAQQNATEKKGVFSGDLFSGCTSMKEYRFNLIDTIRFIQMFQQQVSDDPSISQTEKEILIPVCSSLQSRVSAAAIRNNFLFILRQYDDGEYFTINLMNKGEVFLTASYAKSGDGDFPVLVFGHSEGGKNYYNRFSFQTEKDQIIIRSSLFSDAGHTGYAFLKDGPFLVSSVLKLNSAAEGTFEYVLSGPEQQILNMEGNYLLSADTQTISGWLIDQRNGKENKVFLRIAHDQQVQQDFVSGKTPIILDEESEIFNQMFDGMMTLFPLLDTINQSRQ